MTGLKNVKKMDLPTKIWLANEIRVWGLAVSAILAIVSFGATWAQTRWTTEYAALKDEAAKIAKQESDERIAEANARAAEANERSVLAELELARITAPRTLPTAQAAAVTAAVTAYRGQVYYGLLSQVADARPLWGQIVDALNGAGWQLTSAWGLMNGNPPAGVAIDPDVGVTVFQPVNGSGAVKSAAQALNAALQQHGIASRLDSHNEEGRDAVVIIMIGTRPL